jgi:hypothetical protein
MLNLPNFFIIGAAKSGTTTLYDSLCRHPKIFMSEVKEPAFFNNDANFARGLDWYSQTFFQNSSEFPRRGEVTPGYLFWSDKVAPRLQSALKGQTPGFIAIFRDPVARAYSAYWHLRHYGGEALDFVEALAAEPSRLQNNGEALKVSGFIKYAYFQGGCYASQLEVFFKYFPRESFLFLLSDDLRTDYVGTISSIYAFLGVESPEAIQPVVSNAARKMRSMGFYRFLRRGSKVKTLLKPLLPDWLRGKIKSTLIEINMTPAAYPPLDPVIAKNLRIQYMDEITRLESLIGRNLDHWKKG